MKRYLLFCQLALLSIFQAQAQGVFSAGSGPNGFFVVSGTDVYIYGLTLNPTVDLALTNKTLQVSSSAAPGTPPSIQRVYVFNEGFAFTGRVGLFYLTGELNGNTESNLQVAYANPAFTVTTGSVVNDATHYVYKDLASSTTFSAVTAATLGALPVVLTDFTVQKEGEISQLTWKTVTEINSDYFEVQRSGDGKYWTPLSQIHAWNESRIVRNYFYNDAKPLSGLNYYRLKMVDKSGQFAYSKIESLRFENKIGTELYPNPVVEKLKIKVDDWAMINGVKLLNTQGKTVFESDNSIAAREIDMKKFPSGIYMVQVTRTNGSVNVLKVIKQ